LGPLSAFDFRSAQQTGCSVFITLPFTPLHFGHLLIKTSKDAANVFFAQLHCIGELIFKPLLEGQR
jgi:hypothetical protein